MGTPNRWGTCIETNAPQKLDKPMYLPERLFAEVPTLLTNNKKGGIKLNTYSEEILKRHKVTYLLEEKEVLKENPRTGKPYKKPKTIRSWIDLTEIIGALNINSALDTAKLTAKIFEWQLVSVEELQ